MTRPENSGGSCPRGASGAGAGEHTGARAGRKGSLVHRPVGEAHDLATLLEDCLPSFGGAYLRRIWSLLDQAIGSSVPMTLAVAGPVTASGQHLAWLNPLLDTGWFCLVSTTDAVCYHDGHRGLDDAAEHPFHHVPIFGDDGGLRDDRIIRITDIGFDEDVLLDQDHFVSACLLQPEFQRRMTGPEMRSLLGARYAAQERHNGAPEGLLALCHRMAVPIFVGAPADGSVFLNSMKLWTLAREAGLDYRFELDLHEEVFESCAYHYWGLQDAPEGGGGAMGTLILGGGVPKNFNLQPEPALSQILGLEGIRGYLYDIQITTAPVTDGSLSSCPPAEAVTWGKVDRDGYQSTCESLSADYSMVMPFLTKALLEKRDRLRDMAQRVGPEQVLEAHPEARGYLRASDGYRLLDRREDILQALRTRVREHVGELERTTRYPLADAARSADRS